MRPIRFIVVHCTATQPEAKVESIVRYWKEHLKWKSPGYHLIIKADGTYVRLQPDELPTNGVAGYNQHSIHISYIGGIDKQGKSKDTRTEAQLATMETLVRTMIARYPEAKVLGHCDFPRVNKACPSFVVKDWLKQIGL